jgi:hypothetical protein
MVTAIKCEKGKMDSVAEQQNTETSWGTEASSVQLSGSVNLSTLPSSQTNSNTKTLGNTDEAPSSSQRSSDMKFPTPIPGSWQKYGKYGETPHQLIKCMTEAHLHRIKIEDTRSWQQRESREKAQMDHPIPGQGSKAPVVWHWQEDEETGVQKRVRVFQQAVDQYWEMYSNKQWHFDAFYNKWDICTEFNSDTEHPDGPDMDDDFCMSADIGPIHTSVSSVPPTSKLPAKLGSLVRHTTPSLLISPGEDTMDVPCIISPGEGAADVSPPIPPSDESTSNFPSPIIPSSKGSTDVPPSIAPSGKGASDFPPPIVPSGKGASDFPSPIVPPRKSTSNMPAHMNSSGNSSECNPSPINFIGGLLGLLYERYRFLHPGSNDGAVYNSMLDWRSTRAILGLSSESQRCIAVKRFLPLGFPVQTSTDR